MLEWVARPVPVPGEGQVLIRGSFAGVNMIDTYFRKGLYRGQVRRLGQCRTREARAWARLRRWEMGVVPVCRWDSAWPRPRRWRATRSFFWPRPTRSSPVPEGVADEVAAAALLKGMTARYLVKETFRVGPGTTALVYAAAGGTGQIITQWVKQLGGRVIAVVSTPEKAAVVRGLGADHVVLSSDNIAARVREIVKEGVDVAYDSVGKDTFAASLDSLRTRGMLVSFGNASGACARFRAALLLTQKGSLFLTRPSLMHYIADRASFEANANDVFDAIKTFLKVEKPETFKLEDAAAAHTRLESRQTTGSLVLKIE